MFAEIFIEAKKMTQSRPHPLRGDFLYFNLNAECFVMNNFDILLKCEKAIVISNALFYGMIM